MYQHGQYGIVIAWRLARSTGRVVQCHRGSATNRRDDSRFASLDGELLRPSLVAYVSSGTVLTRMKHAH